MRAQTVLTILVVILVSMLSACAGRNVVRGDSDYPQENPTPRHLATISGAVPQDLDISFKAAWKATSNESCRYDVSGIGSAKIYYSLMTDLEFSRNGDRFTLPIPIDKYFPGRCSCALSLIKLIVSRGSGYPSQVDIYYLDHDRTAAKKMDVWCTKSNSAAENKKDWGRCLNFKLGVRQTARPHVTLNPRVRPSAAGAKYSL